jgi:phage terminase large subunit-like protein
MVIKQVDWAATRERFRGRWCCAGIDLSAVDDLTCCVYMFPDKSDRQQVDILMRTWCPAAKISDPKNKYMGQYQAWARAGWIHTTEGNAVDYDFVRREIVADSKVFQIGLVGVDRGFDGIGFSIALGNDLGHSEKRPIIITCTNNPVKIGPVCQEFERRLLEKKLNHGGNPVLRFMVDSVAVRVDADGNKKPDKDKSQGKIDGVMGMLYALDRLVRSKPPAKIKMPTSV